MLKFGVTAISTLAGAAITIWALKEDTTTVHSAPAPALAPGSKTKPLPTREQQLKSLQNEKQFDVLIIGGGATGVGCALDSVTRGLKTALVESNDFACGTSSKSTKLIHGGVRYLQKAIFERDYEQYKLVREAMHERSYMVKAAPHLCHPLPILIPVYQWWKIFYYWAGLKCYDVCAGIKNLKGSSFLTRREVLSNFPMLKQKNLWGGIVYYDGQQDDARMCVTVALTAARNGATICNHVEVLELLKETDASGKQIVCGAKVKDRIANKTFNVKAKCIINATGPFTDSIRLMDDPKQMKICVPSCGTHIVLPGYYCSQHMGLLDPATSDNRVIFFLPWLGYTVTGTTDMSCPITTEPKPTEEEIKFILGEIQNYLNDDVEIRRGDMMAAWSGIRPLIKDPSKKDTQSLVRNHIILVSPSKLITIAGGKWTTYRAMAEETIDAAIKECNLKPSKAKSITRQVPIEGARTWTPSQYVRLVQDYGIEYEIAKHLSGAYGDHAFEIAQMAAPTGKRWPIVGNRIHPDFPYIHAEIIYAIKNEYACTTVDIIARRTRMSFLNVYATHEILPVIVDIMANEFKWNDIEKEKQFRGACKFLETEMGIKLHRSCAEKREQLKLSNEEVAKHTIEFENIDKERRGYISLNDVRRSLKDLPEENLHEILKEVNTILNGQVDLEEYLHLISAVKSGESPDARAARLDEIRRNKNETIHSIGKEISVERSGGGL